MKKKVICIIPARGGSKGIPGKNLKVIAGKPLIAYAIEAAKAVPVINRVVVSTDDPKISETAKMWGAEVVIRPKEISGDSASSESALFHVLDYLNETENYNPETIVFLQCTSPLTKADDIQGTYDSLIKYKADSALSVTPFHYFLWKNDGKDAVGINHNKQYRPRRQDREQQYLETGAVYVMRTAGFKKAKHRFFGHTAMYEMPRERVLEIDDVSDLAIAEYLINKNHAAITTANFKNIKALITDFDGVMTDNRVIVNQHAEEAVICNRSDGFGIARLVKTGFPVLVISTEKNPVVTARCRKLGIECRQSIADKTAVLKSWLKSRSIKLSQAIYVGNDINDLSCMKIVGLPIAVANAYPEVKNAAKLVLKNKGGHGALREITEYLISSRSI